MKLLTTFAIVVASATAANAGFSVVDIPTKDVPEISAVAGFAALGVVGAVAALIWERRR